MFAARYFNQEVLIRIIWEFYCGMIYGVFSLENSYTGIRANKRGIPDLEIFSNSPESYLIAIFVLY